MIRIVIMGLVGVGCLCQSVSAQTETDRGIVGGGVAGAVIGGIIGHQNDETLEGALLGGAVGAVAGGWLGHEKDRQIQRQYYYQQQYQQQQAVRYAQGVSEHDVVVMSQNGVSPDVIINQIRMNGVQRRPGVHEIIRLHQQGVAEPVIQAMQQSRLATAPVSAPPVVVEDGYHRPPVIIYRPGPVPRYHWHHHHWYR